MVSFIVVIIVVLLLLIIFSRAVAIARGDEFITIERKWFGKQMPDGRTIALRHEVGIQARTLGPGVHYLVPFIYKVKKHKFINIGTNEVGLVTAFAGAPIPLGEFFAYPVDCDLFQNGEKFLINNGQKGPQLAILPPGQHRVNPFLFTVSIVNAVIVDEDEVGLVEAVGGTSCAAGRIFADPVECDSFQDAVAFLKNGGQKGPQISVLAPGKYRINTSLFKVEKVRATVIPGGKIGLITAMDGTKIPDGHLLGQMVEGHSNFEKGDIFIKNGGQKGRQLSVVMPGKYRINTALFNVTDIVDWTRVESDQIGIITVLEGRPISDTNKIAADSIDVGKHDNFQNSSAFITEGGQKGLQIPVLRSGNYAINPWFAKVELCPMVEVKIGECAVITSFVGEEGNDVTDEKVNAKIVENGKKGIWKDPLGPGRHALNTKVCKVDIVPTTQILLNWADNESSAHKYDSNLNTITLRTADALNVHMDVSVIIHIAMQDAPKVIANLGSVTNMISQVLEPAISSHFRNAAQSVMALELYTKRAELQQKAKEHIQLVLKDHHIESKDTMIANVVLPAELTKTVTDRQIAEQEKMTYAVQKQAQEERKLLENATAQANMQKDVVVSERGVEIAKNLANSEIEKSQGEAKATEIRADGSAKAIKLSADANAEATLKVGKAEAEVIGAKGKSTAEAYKAQNQAMGSAFGQLKIVEALASNKMKLVPDALVTGGDNNGGGMGNLLGITLLERIAGKNILHMNENESEEKEDSN